MAFKVEQTIKGTTYEAAVLEYFPGDGLSSSYRTPGGIPMTAYRYNVVGDQLTTPVVEGDTVQLPASVADRRGNHWSAWTAVALYCGSITTSSEPLYFAS